MLEIDIPGRGVVVVTLGESSGADELAELVVAVDRHRQENGEFPNLVILTDRLRDWGAFQALEVRLLHICGRPGGTVGKLAIVGDDVSQMMADRLGDHVASTRVRHFFLEEKAKDWVALASDAPGRLEQIGGLSQDVVALRASGLITAQEYRETVIRLVEERAKHYPNLKLLLVMDRDFDSFSHAATWQDLDFGLSHQDLFSKVAVVTDSGAFVHGDKVFAPLMWASIRAFKLSELDAAREWVELA